MRHGFDSRWTNFMITDYHSRIPNTTKKLLRFISEKFFDLLLLFENPLVLYVVADNENHKLKNKLNSSCNQRHNNIQ